MMNNTELWNSWSRPPKEALKTIGGGRLKGMTDIRPQWRYQVLTEQLGPCGIGWRYDIHRQWTEPGSEGQTCAFCNVSVRIKDEEGEWSAPIPGTGGSMLVEKERSGLHTNDEAFKMALTDALSVALTRLGVANDIYMGNWDGSKYKTAPKQANPIADAINGTKHPDQLLELLQGWGEKREVKDHIEDWERIHVTATGWVRAMKWEHEGLRVFLDLLDKQLGGVK